MRSSVSYILSHAPGESVMSHPDYGQHAQHHACLLVLVKGIGGMLKNFNKLWERLQRVNNIKVTGLYTLYTSLISFNNAILAPVCAFARVLGIGIQSRLCRYNKLSMYQYLSSI